MKKSSDVVHNLFTQSNTVGNSSLKPMSLLFEGFSLAHSKTK